MASLPVAGQSIYSMRYTGTLENALADLEEVLGVATPPPPLVGKFYQKEQDKSPDIDDRKYSKSASIKKGEGYTKPTGTSYSFDKVWKRVIFTILRQYRNENISFKLESRGDLYNLRSRFSELFVSQMLSSPIRNPY